MWKPRELMLFADDLAKTNLMLNKGAVLPTKLLQKWSHHLRGLPLFRIERTKYTNKFINKFGMTLHMVSLIFFFLQLSI